MAIGKITLPGLTGMAVSVALLWGCLIGEHIIVRRATREQKHALLTLQRLRQRQQSQPVLSPVLVLPRPLRPSAG